MLFTEDLYCPLCIYIATLLVLLFCEPSLINTQDLACGLIVFYPFDRDLQMTSFLLHVLTIKKHESIYIYKA